MSEAVGFSLLPGTANAGNANFPSASGGAPASVKGATGGASDVQLLDFTIQSTRKTVEILLAQVQLLSMRVEALEKQNAFLMASFQQQHGGLGIPGANASGSGNVPGSGGSNNGGNNSPFLSPKQHAANGASALLDSPSAAVKHLEDDLQRMGLNPANLLNSPSQQQALVDGFNGNALYAHQQQQLAAAMAQHQREEAIVQMLQGQGSPTVATPTATFPLGFPVNPNASGAIPVPGGNNSTTGGGPGSPDPSGGMANMAYLYSPTSHGAPSGSPNAPQQPHHMILQQHNGGSGGAAPMFSMNGPGGMFGYPPGGAGMGPGAAGAGMMGPGGPGANMTTTVTLDPNKNNNNESLDRVCQQPWLKELIMKNCKNISNFTPIAKLRNLWKLNLQGCSQHVDDNVVKLISTYNKRLSRLNLCGCEKITNATPLQYLNFLFDLNLSGCNIGNDSLEAVANGCQQLSRLAINSCPLITDISSLRKLKELKLLYCRYSGHISPVSIVQVLHEIGAGLLTLNVDGVKFSQLPNLMGPDAVTGSTLPLPLALKNLNMKDNTELTTLTWLTTLPGVGRYFANLEMLDVEGCSGLVELGNLSVFPSLKFLRLSKTTISQESLEAIVTQCPSVHQLYVDGCPNIKSVECLAQMQSLAKLIVDPALNSAPATANGLAALYQTNRVEVVFANHNANTGSGGGGHHFAGNGTGGTSASQNGSPTSNYVPAIPAGERK